MIQNSWLVALFQVQNLTTLEKLMNKNLSPYNHKTSQQNQASLGFLQHFLQLPRFSLPDLLLPGDIHLQGTFYYFHLIVSSILYTVKKIKNQISFISSFIFHPIQRYRNPKKNNLKQVITRNTLTSFIIIDWSFIEKIHMLSCNYLIIKPICLLH